MSHTTMEASRRLIEEAFGEGRLEILDRICAEGFVSHDPLAGDQDLEGVKESIAGYRHAFADLTFTVDDIFEAGDKVVLRWTASGTFENEFMGLEPTHEKGDPVKGISIDRYDGEGRLAESWSQWDTVTFMRDVGAIPRAAAAAVRS